MRAKEVIRNFVPIFLVLCLQVKVYSQAPQGFSYQAVVRNGAGSPIVSQTVGLRITLENTAHTPYYTETHAPTSSAQGVISVVVGKGTQVGSNLFSGVPWGSGDVLIKLEIDPAGGTSYVPMGSPTKLQSVPYALYAENTKEVVSSPNALDDDPIFEVKNKNGQVVFGVYQGGVRVYVEDSPITKGAKGGFAVGGLTLQAKGPAAEYMRITSDSARIYVNENTAKGAKGGFAVGGLTLQAKAIQSRNLMYVAPDSTRIYVNENVTKGAKGGFAVGGLTLQGKSSGSDYFNVSPSSVPTVISSNAQMLWYPLKEAFLVGRVQVLDPNDVGLNSFASGYHSKAKGNYSQAMGTSSVASGLYSMAIGESCLASGQYSFALGSNSQATNSYNVAIGNNSQAIGYSNNYAFGNNASASGDNDNYAFDSNSKIVEGRNCYAIGSNAEIYPLVYNGSGSAGSYAIGNYALVKGQRAYAIGDHARALNNDAIAFGTNTKSTAYVSIAIGANGSNADTTSATGQASIAMGYAASSGGLSSISLGTRSVASSDYSVAIGNDAQATAINATAIGNGAISSAPNKVRIGNSTVSVIEGQVAFSNASDKRLKQNIKDLSSGLDFILKLHPVEYQMKQGDNRLNFGFIAQDIEQLIGINNSILTIGSDPERALGLRYTDFIAPLVKALQEQQKQIEELKQKNEELSLLKDQYNNLKAELEQIKALMNK